MIAFAGLDIRAARYLFAIPPQPDLTVDQSPGRCPGRFVLLGVDRHRQPDEQAGREPDGGLIKALNFQIVYQLFLCKSPLVSSSNQT